MKLVKTLRDIRKRFSSYKPSVEVLISKSALLHNLHKYQQHYPKLLFAPVLKSNAYGHGLIKVAQILDKEDIAFFAVDSLYEAMVLRNEGIRSDILVIGYTSPENIRNSRLARIAFTVTSLDQLQDIEKIISRKIRVHLKVDTGMHRQGILPNEIEKAVKIFKENSLLVLEGICSHLADADNIDPSYTKHQFQEWERICSLFQEEFKTIKYFHIAATAGMPYTELAFGNVARLGIGLYGIDPFSNSKMNLKPVLSLRSIISSLKSLETGECVGYNTTYKTESRKMIATIPVGYFEGVDRRLSNIGFVQIEGQCCPIIGRISMNISSVDVTGLKDVKLGDKVIIISNNRSDKNSVQNIAKITNTIPWEILIHIPSSLRRTVID